MMVFVSVYLISMVIMALVCGCLIYKDGKKDFTYGSLIVSVVFTFIPLVNTAAVVSTVIVGLSFLWDEYADKPVFK